MSNPKDRNRHDYIYTLTLLLFFFPGLFLASELAHQLSWRERPVLLLTTGVTVVFAMQIGTWRRVRIWRRNGQPAAEDPAAEPDWPLGMPSWLTNLPLILGYVLVLIVAGLATVWFTEILLREPYFQGTLPFIPTLALAFFLVNAAVKRLRRRPAEETPNE